MSPAHKFSVLLGPCVYEAIVRLRHMLVGVDGNRDE
jgi:hypothetical protein